MINSNIHICIYCNITSAQHKNKFDGKRERIRKNVEENRKETEIGNDKGNC